MVLLKACHVTTPCVPPSQRKSCGKSRRRTTPSPCDRSWRRNAADAASWSKRSTTSCEPGELLSNAPEKTSDFPPRALHSVSHLAAWKTHLPRAPKSRPRSHLQPAAVKVSDVSVDGASTQPSWVWPVCGVLSSTLRQTEGHSGRHHPQDFLWPLRRLHRGLSLSARGADGGSGRATQRQKVRGSVLCSF